MANEVSPTDPAFQIRTGTGIGASTEVGPKDRDLMMAIDQIRLKVSSGGQLSTEEQTMLDQLEGRRTPEPAAPAAAPAAPGAPAQPAQEPAGAGSGMQSEIDTIIAKMEKGETISPEEQGKVDEFLAKPTVEEKIFKIGGKEFKTSELFQQWAKEKGVDAATVPPHLVPGIIDDYVTAKNKAEWERAYTRRDQEAARTRRYVSEQTALLMNKHRDLDDKIKTAERNIVAAQALAQKSYDPNQAYDENGRLKIEVMAEINEIVAAKRNVPQLMQELESLKTSSVQTEKELVVQRLRDFQEAHPEFRTSQDIAVIAGQLGTGSLSEEDEIKFSEIVQVVRTADGKGWNPDRELQYQRDRMQILTKPSSQPVSTTEMPSYQREEAARQQLLASLKAKRAQSVAFAGGGVPIRQAPVTPATLRENVARNVVRASTQIAITGSESQAQAAKLAGEGY